MVTITLDGREYPAEEGRSVLEVARTHNIPIPTLCYHPSLRPSGSCRLCAVEVPGRSSGRQVTMLACVLNVKNGLAVKTQGDAVNRARTRAFRNLLQMAPQAKKIIELAKTYDIDPGPPPDGCVRCRLCVRVCKEIVGAGALKMEKRDGKNYVVPIEGLCIGCGTCTYICPTGCIEMVGEPGPPGGRRMRMGSLNLEPCPNEHACETCELDHQFMEEMKQIVQEVRDEA